MYSYAKEFSSLTLISALLLLATVKSHYAYVLVVYKS